MSARPRSSPIGPRWPEPIYLDASALVKLFVPAAESDALNEARVGAKDVIVSDLALTEMASALGRRALDALQVASALDADAATVVTFDPKLRAVAAAQSLHVAPEAE